jgi:RNA recognition motif-containing protein
LFRDFGHVAQFLRGGSLAFGGNVGKKLYVGNLPYSATEQVLVDTFAECGTVESAKIIMDRDSGRSKGFAFVEMSTDQEAQNAISKFNGADWEGRAMTVNEAKPMAPRENRGGGGGGGFGGGGRGGGGGGGGGGGRW